MEKERNNKGLIIALIIIIVILAALCVLFATGTISLKNKEPNSKEQVTNNEKTTNKNIEDSILKELLPIIGADKDYVDGDSGTCNYISLKFKNENSRLDSYTKDEAYNLIILNYIENYSPIDYTSKNEIDEKNCTEKSPVIPSGRCTAYSKEIVKEIANKYDFDYTVEEIFGNNDNIQKEDEKNYYAWANFAGHCAGMALYKHNISSWYDDTYDTNDEKSAIIIRDEITIKYSNGDNSNRIVYYTFKKDNDGNYKLWLYEVY